MPKPLRVVFAGTPPFAAAHLEAVLSSRHDVVAVYTQPDRPAGRGKQLPASAVKQVALSHSLPVLQPASLKTQDEVTVLAELKADLLIVVAYGLILPLPILALPKQGCINVHASLLPRWRGAAPIHRAIESGDTETGVTIMQMDPGLDTGDMLMTAKMPIEPSHTTGSLTYDLQRLGAETLVSALNLLDSLQSTAVAQPSEGVTYAHKITKDEAMIDWAEPAEVIARKVRAFNPAPVCFTSLDGQRIKLWEAVADTSDDSGDSGLSAPPGTILSSDKTGLKVQTGAGAVTITRLQLPNKKPMSIADIINGQQIGFSRGSCFEHKST